MALERSATVRRARSRKSRGRGLRTTTGCTTCRKRHLKCDEVKPVCGACHRGDQNCRYVRDQSEEARAPSSKPDEEMNDAGIVQGSSEDISGLQSTQSTESWSSSPPSNSAAGPTIAPRNAFQIASPTVCSTYTYLHPSWEEGMDLGHSLPLMSPDALTVCSLSSTDPMADAATMRWFGMLVGDASFEESGLPNIEFDLTMHPMPVGQREVRAGSGQFMHEMNGEHVNVDAGSPQHAKSAASEEAMWRAPETLVLREAELAIFGHFVRRISTWIDLFDPMRHFSTSVPHLAMHNVGLLNAILCVSRRHLAFDPDAVSAKPPLGSNDALQNYHETLQYVQKAMQYDSYNTSPELLATALIVSAYEMIDGSGKDWERHLQGVFWIQRAQVIHGDSQGLKQAVWWAWLCQDVWAAFRDGRKTFSFWKPTRKFDAMTPWELAARSVFVMAKVVNYCSREEADKPSTSIGDKVQTADKLLRMLNEWERCCPVEFSPLPVDSKPDSKVFTRVWIHPPTFGIAMQLHYSARILLWLHRPSLGGMAEFMDQQIHLASYVDMICGIAVAQDDFATSIVSSQCLFIAGMCTSDSQRRSEILRLLSLRRQRSGWPKKPLSDELKNVWAGSKSA